MSYVDILKIYTSHSFTFLFCQFADESSSTIAGRTNRYLSNMLQPPLIHPWIWGDRNNPRRGPAREEQHFRVRLNGFSRALFYRVWTREGVNWVGGGEPHLVPYKKNLLLPSCVDDNCVRIFLSSYHGTWKKKWHKLSLHRPFVHRWQKNGIAF